ncbi:MAG: metallophosphoesterase family protein [Candidatus Binatota bacterium]
MKKSLIGVISDTHGLIRPESLRALRGAELIIHAGDIGKPDVIETLKSIAPVVAIRGNNDREKWARKFPETAVVKVGKIRIHVIHNVKELEIDPAAAGFRVVISGHSHRPLVLRRGGVLFLNSGSAGPRRFKLPVAVARLSIKGESVSPRILELMRGRKGDILLFRA